MGEFISVRPELIKLCGGANEAMVVALIDYRTRPEFRSSHIDDLGRIWWPISITALAEASGLTYEQTRHALKRAEERGLVETDLHHTRGDSYDRRKSYRVVYDQSQMDLGNVTGDGVTVPKWEVGNIPNVPLFKELEELKEEPAYAVTVAVKPFEEFWSVYPLKRGRKDAESAFAKAIKRASVDDIVRGASAYALSLGSSPDLSKVKWAQGWLNGDRWKDEISVRSGSTALQRNLQKLEQMRSQAVA